jgi:hypothetical protein
LQDADSFIWKIGSGTYNKKSFSLNDFPKNVLLNVSLVLINKNPNKNCFPEDNGIDTSFKTIFVWPEEKVWSNNTCLFPNPMPIKGTYKGFYKSKPNIETILKFYDTATYCFSTSSNQVLTNPYLINLPLGFATPDSCEYRHSSIDNLPFACILRSTNGVALINTKNQKTNRATLDALAILDKDRKKISIKLNWIDDFGSHKDEFIGIKIK